MSTSSRLNITITPRPAKPRYSADYQYGELRPSVIRMDPDCAICHAPANMACDCEAKGLDQALRQAEARMMQSIYTDIRHWVRSHAQDYILEYFRLLTDRRKVAHAAHLDRIQRHAYHYYHAQPHPQELAAAQAVLKRGIDEDWQASVQRYPEVLEYFYSLVQLNLPDDDEPAVKDPPLSALSGGLARKGTTGGRRGGGGGAPASVGVPDMLPRRTPPPIEARRTPNPRGGRRYAPPPAMGPTTYYTPYGP